MHILSVVSNYQRSYRWAVANTICVALVVALLFGASDAIAQSAEPPVQLPQAARGEQAIRVLGEKLPAVAQTHGLKSARLRELFRRDPNLVVDRTARLLYTDPELPDSEGSDTADGESPSGSYPLQDTFKLHSKPGANRVIYLDFDGHVLENSAWNSYSGVSRIDAPAWDIDGDPSSFSDQERARIQKIWQRVAEDYAGFDVDVTTEYLGESVITRSSTSDNEYGTRVLISAISKYFGNYGGIAYVGVYSSTGDYYKPALVFPENLANDAKYIAEATSHEAGHNLGLNHDGTKSGTTYYAGHGSGDTGWAPVMGNSYYNNLTQFSKGEYPDANNTEDDFVVIQNNGLSWAVDDHGDALNEATALALGTTITGSGVVEQRADVDTFRFDSGAGTLTVDFAPEPYGPNLDIRAQLLDSSGGLIAESQPSSYLSAAITAAVGEGSYFLRIEGVGKGDLSTGYSDYASLGRYSFLGTVPPTSGNQAPTALASASTLIAAAPLAVSFSSAGSSDSDGTIVTYHWVFGDGAGSSEPNPSYTYTNGGTFTVTLTVTDDLGATDSDSLQVTVDATNPTVSISSPAEGSTLAGIAAISVAASDDTGVSAVELYLDGALIGTDAVAPYEFAWNTTAVSDGSYALSAKAYDNYGHAGTSATVSVNVQNSDSTAPTVSITSPTNGSTVSGTTKVAASASDDVGVSYVELYIDGGLQASDAAAPFEFNWDTTTVADGEYTLLAKAYDAAGNLASSSVVSVTVSNSTSGPTMVVSNIALDLAQKGPNYQGLATVLVRDQDGQVVKSAAVSAAWSLNGAALGSVEGSTNGQGDARLQSDKLRLRSGDVLTVTITGITASGYQYDSASNTETSESVVVP